MPESSSEPEAWRAVVGAGGAYEVSDLGRVRSLKWSEPRVLTQTTVKNGYRSVTVAGVSRLVHHLVLEAWVEPRPWPTAEGRHGDRDPGNNRPGNLSWGTRLDNAADKRRHGTHNNTVRETCRKRGHRLVDPNLDPVAARHGGRKCYACRWASLAVSNARAGGRPIPDADALAASMYAFLMEGGPDPRPAPRANTHAERVKASRSPISPEASAGSHSGESKEITP